MEYQNRLVNIKSDAYYVSSKADFTLYEGDSFNLLPLIDRKFDMIFADPPYFLSGGGISMQSGKVVCVDKGEWDKVKTAEEMLAEDLLLVLPDGLADLKTVLAFQAFLRER